MYDIDKNVEMAAADVMNHIEAYGKIRIDEYNEVCRHYRVNRNSLQAATHPYSYWCMDCGLITTLKNWNEVQYLCRSCADKYKKKMSGFVMQRAYDSKKTLEQTDIISALKYSMNYEADLYMDGKLISSPLGWDHDYLAEVLKPLGVIQSYKNNSLHWRYADESKNINKLYCNSYEYMWEGELQVQVNVHDYPESKGDIVFDTEDEIKEYAVNNFGQKVEKINIHYYLNNELWSLNWEKDKGWLVETTYYIVGILDTFVPPWLCIYADNEKQAIEKYIEKYKHRLFDDEKHLVKAHGTSKVFIYGDLYEYVKSIDTDKE